MSGTFDLLDRPLVYIPVRWNGVMAGDDGSAVTVEHEVSLQVELLDKEELAEWLKLSNRETGDDDARTHALEVFKRVCKGWRRMKSAGKNAPFNDENIWRLLTWPGFDLAFNQAYGAAWRGKVEEREGNSEGSPVDGRAETSTGSTEAADASSES